MAAISFANDTQAYTLMGTVTEKDITKYNNDPMTVERKATGALVYLFKNHAVKKN